jgi:hypothetical protein
VEVALNGNVGLFLDREAHLFDQLRQFYDIRKKPQIRLQDILMCVLFMPFFSLTSLLGLDRTTRKCSFKRLFRSERKMVVSDSTVARVLNWLDAGQVQRFQRAFLPVFEQHSLAKRELVPGGKARRLGIIDGSCMGTHYLSMLDLCGKTDYPVMFLPYDKQGKELPTSRLLLRQAKTTLGSQFPELLLLDGEYFTKNIFDEVAAAKASLLIKSKEPFRDVHQDAQLLFQAKAKFPGDIIEESGFDVERCCHWSIEITSGQFAGYALQVAHLVEDYPKRKANRHVECWIVTTELSLLPREIREAAHLRWHVENNVFKRLSKQSGTKRFHFKDPRRFYSMLRLLCTAVALFDMLIAILQRAQEQFKQILNGIKATWNNIFSQLAESFSEGFLAGDSPAG